MKAFANEFGVQPSTLILDVGGTPFNWRLLDHLPDVTLLNIPDQRTGRDSQGIRRVIGDGCSMPFDDASYPIVFSNSTIEHVGTWERQRQFAQEIRRVGRSYYVQTPNRWFFVEPHYLTPFIHWVPTPARRKLLRYGTVWGLLARPSAQRQDERIAEIRLLTAKELGQLFPEATIRRERVLGLTKSLIAVHHA